MSDTLTGSPALDAVNAALATVQDPEINRPLPELGMVKDVQIGADGSVRVEVYLTVAGCPMRETITNRVTTKSKYLVKKDVTAEITTVMALDGVPRPPCVQVVTMPPGGSPPPTARSPATIPCAAIG